MNGETISHYRVLAKLGEGGMGIVYKAEDTNLRRVVALKCLRERGQHDEEIRARFIREAQAAAVLDHPNICSVYELGEHEGQLFLAMAFVEGHPLSRWRGASKPPLYQAVRIAGQIAEGLRAAHQKGIVHRDIKSENVLITPAGEAKITDFGLALIRDRSRLTQPGTIMGTVTHMSPEQALAKTTDRRTDIWSLGVLLYEMVEGRLPFKANTAQATMVQLVSLEMPALKACKNTEIERILRKTLAKDPAQRYQHADDLIVDLRAVLKQLPEAELPPIVVLSPDEPTMTMHRPAQPVAVTFTKKTWMTGAIAFAATLALAAAVYYFFLRDTAP